MVAQNTLALQVKGTGDDSQMLPPRNMNIIKQNNHFLRKY